MGRWITISELSGTSLVQLSLALAIYELRTVLAQLARYVTEWVPQTQSC